MAEQVTGAERLQPQDVGRHVSLRVDDDTTAAGILTSYTIQTGEDLTSWSGDTLLAAQAHVTLNLRNLGAVTIPGRTRVTVRL